MSTITLCGSARFEAEFHHWNKVLTLAGHTVFGLTAYPSQNGGNKDWYDAATKVKLDLAHLRKIQESDAILVLNVGGYVGPSTAREIEWAASLGKDCYFIAPRIMTGDPRSPVFDYRFPQDNEPVALRGHPDVCFWELERPVHGKHFVLQPI